MNNTKTDRLASIEKMRLYTLTEIEPILGVTHRTLLSYIKNGRLKGVKIGGKWKVNEDALRELIYGTDKN